MVATSHDGLHQGAILIWQTAEHFVNLVQELWLAGEGFLTGTLFQKIVNAAEPDQVLRNSVKGSVGIIALHKITRRGVRKLPMIELYQ